MIFEIEVNGRSRTVAVERAGDGPTRYRVKFDGVSHLVDAVQVEPDTLSLVLPEQASASHEVGFADAQTPGEVSVHLHGGTLTASVNGRRSRRGAASGAAAGQQQRVMAPMPGKVLRILVGAGDQVAARQPLVVVEAMKMENELSCSRAGTVREVTVAPGQSVEAGRLLVIVE